MNFNFFQTFPRTVKGDASILRTTWQEKLSVYHRSKLSKNDWTKHGGNRSIIETLDWSAELYP